MARIEVRRQRARLGRGLFALAALWFGFLGLMAPAPPARATGGAVITNGTVGLGVHNEGHLIIPSEIRSAGGELRFGLRLLQGQFESLSPGCDCEGWGIADPDAGISGDANESNGGVHNLTPISFAATPTSADSVVKLDDLFEIRHHYFPSPATRFLYECQVTVKNISSKRVGQFLYRRLMDWDVEPTPFREFVTIQRGTAAALVFSSDDGFGEADPLQALDEIEEGTLNTSFEDSGPADHGAAFDFSFLNLDPGASQTFSIFYGAAPTEAEAEGALWAVGAEVFSLGQSSGAEGPTLGRPATFIFGFAGVGGTPVFGQLESVTVTEITQTSARVNWRTSKPTAGRVRAGKSETGLTREVRDPKVRQDHSVVLNGLTPRQPTFFQVVVDLPTPLRPRGPAPKPEVSVVRYLIPGRGRVDGLTPSFSPSVSGKTVKMDISIFNTCRDPAKEVSVKELFVEQGEKQFQPLGFKIPQTIGFIKGQGTTNLQVEFPAEALAGSPGLPQRIVIGGEKLIGASPPKRCLAWRDFVNLPPIPGLVRSSLPATPRRTSAPHIRNVECEAQGGRP